MNEPTTAEILEDFSVDETLGTSQLYYVDLLANRLETAEAKIDRLTSRGFEDLHHENEQLKRTIKKIGELPIHNIGGVSSFDLDETEPMVFYHELQAIIKGHNDG